MQHRRVDLLIADFSPAAQGELLWRVSLPLSALALGLLAIPLAFVNPRGGNSLNQLFALLAQTIERETATLVSNGIAVDFLGRLEELPEEAAQRIQRACDATAAGGAMQLHVAFNYGGRTELVAAVRAIVRSGISAEKVDPREAGPFQQVDLCHDETRQRGRATAFAAVDRDLAVEVVRGLPGDD